ncbi:MAG: hypothetical protein Q7J16_05740 [Candidatus Cloacimonadales bacterium]|nr:hypothetical protein [Candidatus Cloacimonadales bacterium]
MNYHTLEIEIKDQVGTVFFNRQNDLDNQILQQLVAESTMN